MFTSSKESHFRLYFFAYNPNFFASFIERMFVFRTYIPDDSTLKRKALIEMPAGRPTERQKEREALLSKSLSFRDVSIWS